MKIRNIIMLTALALLTAAQPSALPGAVDGISVTVDDALPGEIVTRGFTLDKKTTVTVSGAVGVFTSKGKELISYSWIIGSADRRTVWDSLENRQRLDKGLTSFSSRVTLPAGDYEMFQTCQSNRFDFEKRKNILSAVGNWVEDLFTSSHKDPAANFSEKLKLTVTGEGKVMREVDPRSLASRFADRTAIRLTGAGENANLRQAFALSSETRVRIYALGEAQNDVLYDYGSIRDLKTGKTAWSMTAHDTEWAGGAEKNVRVSRTITLPAGRYMAVYVSDDSHGCGAWNSLPPHDPQYWGLSIGMEKPEDSGLLTLLDNTRDAAPVISVLRMKEKSSESLAFEVKEPLEVQVLCIGEGEPDDDGDDLTDYGWIKQAKTNKIIWDMRRCKTQQAGGAEKNRLVRDRIHLEKGFYLLSFMTDTGHNFGAWNAAPPSDPHLYGISLWVDNPADSAKILAADKGEWDKKDVLTRIVRIRNDSSETQSFSLAEDGEIRILAIGEGFRDEDLTDLGWITERATGRILWKMTWDNTEPAGGAAKNRRFAGILRLSKGDYILHFKTDDSHAYGDWNDDAPDDPDMYGITLYTIQ